MKKITSYFLLLFTITLFGNNNPCRLLLGNTLKKRKFTKHIMLVALRHLILTIIWWRKYIDLFWNEIIIDIIIKTNGNDEEKVIEKLKEIDVEFNGNKIMLRLKQFLPKTHILGCLGSNPQVKLKCKLTMS